MTFAEYQAASAALEQALRDATACHDAIRDTLAAELGIPARGAMGLTPDAIKFAPRYRAAKRALDRAVATSRAFHGQYAGRFKKEIRAAIDARRLAKLQS